MLSIKKILRFIIVESRANQVIVSLFVDLDFSDAVEQCKLHAAVFVFLVVDQQIQYGFDVAFSKCQPTENIGEDVFDLRIFCRREQ